jgi:hypothetical protein
MMPGSLIDVYRRFGNYFLYLGFEVLRAVIMKSNTFWDIRQFSPLRGHPALRKKILPPSYCLYIHFPRASRTSKPAVIMHFTRSFLTCSHHSSTLKMEAVRFPNTLVNVYQITRHDMIKECSLYGERHENVISTEIITVHTKPIPYSVIKMQEVLNVETLLYPLNGTGCRLAGRAVPLGVSSGCLRAAT